MTVDEALCGVAPKVVNFAAVWVVGDDEISSFVLHKLTNRDDVFDIICLIRSFVT